MLAVWDGTESAVVPELVLASGERLVPVRATHNLIQHGAIVLPEGPAPYGSIEQLSAALEEYIARYVVVSDGFRRLAAAYVLFSWVYDAFAEVPYLRVQADWGSGKTRALITIGSLCYRGFFASGASTVSPIFHTLDTFRGTLILDEADFRFSDQTAELTKILNNGNVQGFPVFRTAITRDKEFDPRAFTVFGPKLVAMRKPFADEALESRFITEYMQAMPVGASVPINLPGTQGLEAAALRNMLLQYRFDHRHMARINPALIDPRLAPRTNQILVPLLSIVPDASVRDEISEAVYRDVRARAAGNAASIEAELVSIIGHMAAVSPTEPIPVGEIARQFAVVCGADCDRPITPRYVGSLLRQRLGLYTHKSNGNYVVMVPSQRLAILAARYGLDTGTSGDVVGA